jgi:hypothetical protein
MRGAPSRSIDAVKPPLIFQRDEQLSLFEYLIDHTTSGSCALFDGITA